MKLLLIVIKKSDINILIKKAFIHFLKAVWKVLNFQHKLPQTASVVAVCTVSYYSMQNYRITPQGNCSGMGNVFIDIWKFYNINDIS